MINYELLLIFSFAFIIVIEKYKIASSFIFLSNVLMYFANEVLENIPLLDYKTGFVFGLIMNVIIWMYDIYEKE